MKLPHTSRVEGDQFLNSQHALTCSGNIGCVVLGKSRSGFPNPKTDLPLFWSNPKTDHGSIKSTLRVVSSDRIQIRIFEIHNLSGFFWERI